MKLKYLSTIIPQQEGESKITSIVCAPNGLRCAIACSDRSIALIDENGNIKDRIPCKPVDPKYGKKSFTILCMAFSPDSSSIAVGQSDNVVYVYKIGTSWNEKKVIVNKFIQPAAVSSLCWPFDDKIIIGLIDGKVRIGLNKTNKCSSLFKTDQSVVSIKLHPKRISFVSGHQDGSIILYNFSSRTQSKICNLKFPPYHIAFTHHGLLIAGADRRIVSYTENGIVQQQFDYSDSNEKGFTAIVCDPTSQNVVVGSYNRLRLLSWSTRRGAWDEGEPLEIENLYVVTALGWKMDGSTVYVGTICGGLLSIDCCLKRGMLKSKFETTYVAPSHVIIKNIINDTRTSVLSNKGLAIDELKIMGKDRFVVGYTSSTMLLADTETQKCSEIEWQSGGHEKFYFEFTNTCLIINAGEITIIEFGKDDLLGWVRTELINPHLLSVRVNNEETNKEKVVKKLAYLIDPTTIAIVNLMNSQQECIINHTNGIDWIELNESATKLLYRDKRSKVTLADIATDQKSILLSFCTYVQWVPMSDVIVAQSGETLSIWYNPDLPEQVTNIQIKGEVEIVLRDSERTEVIVQESTAKVAYELDNTQIEFGSALEKKDLERAVQFLRSNPGSPDVYSMWTRVAEQALESNNLAIAQQCFAAVNDYARVKTIFEIRMINCSENGLENNDESGPYKVKAMIAVMRRKFKDAERIYVENNDVESAIEMYTTIHHWEEALELAKAVNYAGLEKLRTAYLRTLNDTGQDSKAAELKSAEGDPQSAVHLYLKANKPLLALNTALDTPSLAKNDDLLKQIADSLIRAQIFDKAGNIYEKQKDFDKALECYRKGNAFSNAVELSRFAFPENVVQLEEEWGNYLTSIGQYEAAINHFLESNKTQKAVEAAIRAKEWNKAVHIVDIIQDRETSKQYYGRIADHYASIGEFDRAERLFIEADLQKEAITMYIKNNKWADAYRLSEEFLGKEETLRLYERKAEELEEQLRFAEAEQLYVSIGLANKAIHMYKEAGRDEDVLRLVERYHGEHLQETRKRFAMDYEERGDYRAAEEEFLKAGDWKSAINMYKENEMWADAHRIAKSEGGENAEQQVLFLWARSLGGDAAVKLLNKNAMLNDAIDFACEAGAYDFAFELARLGAKDRINEVHARMGVQLEEEGRLAEAAKQYIEGGKPEEAVKMFIHDKDWASAEKIAQEHAPKLLVDVYTGEARKALEENDHMRAESFLLRANKPEIILRYFKEAEMWPDALRIAKEYLPHQLPLIQEEYEKAELRTGARGVDSFLAQARDWEQQGEWSRAVQALLRIDDSATDNKELIQTSIKKAAELTIKFLLADEQIIADVLNGLNSAECHETAAELLLTIGQTRLAINALCNARQWSKAKQLATEYLPEMIPEIEKYYKDSLKNEGNLGELINVDVITAIDLMIERDQWENALNTARQQNYRPLLDKYVAQYIAILVHRHELHKIIPILETYGASGNPANFTIYKLLVEDCLMKSEIDYEEIAKIRNIHLQVYKDLKSQNSDYIEQFERYIWALHLLSMRAALEEVAEESEVPRLRLQQSLSLLRYTDILPADRIFYEAGTSAKEYGGQYESLGFLLLNHYLDLVDAIDEGNGDLVDYMPFEDTDIPTEVAIPVKQWLEGYKHEETKEWVLAASVDDNASKDLVYDKRDVFEASLRDNRGNISMPCLITGYPVLEDSVYIGNLVANKESLNKFLIVIKSRPTDNLMDAQNFVSQWTGSPLAITL